MLNQVMETFDIKSDYNLHVMTERQTLVRSICKDYDGTAGNI
ncbi:MAG: hypothetical protein ACLUN0_11105 [Roseburia sp.]